jgi:hypothetical protein
MRITPWVLLGFPAAQIPSFLRLILILTSFTPLNFKMDSFKKRDSSDSFARCLSEGNENIEGVKEEELFAFVLNGSMRNRMKIQNDHRYVIKIPG